VGEAETDLELLRLWINGCTHQELITLRAIINGKLGKRKISPEAQAKMQAGRKKHRETP
jgi:hypothetical protein